MIYDIKSVYKENFNRSEECVGVPIGRHENVWKLALQYSEKVNVPINIYQSTSDVTMMYIKSANLTPDEIVEFTYGVDEYTKVAYTIAYLEEVLSTGAYPQDILDDSQLEAMVEWGIVNYYKDKIKCENDYIELATDGGFCDPDFIKAYKDSLVKGNSL